MIRIKLSTTFFGGFFGLIQNNKELHHKYQSIVDRPGAYNKWNMPAKLQESAHLARALSFDHPKKKIEEERKREANCSNMARFRFM